MCCDMTACVQFHIFVSSGIDWLLQALSLLRELAPSELWLVYYRSSSACSCKGWYSSISERMSNAWLVK